MGNPTLRELERHAEKFGTLMVYETASQNGFTKSELARLRLRLRELERQQLKSRRRRGRR